MLQQHTVCLVDADAQGSSSRWVSGFQPTIQKPDVWRVTDPDELIDGINTRSEKYDFTLIDAPGALEEIQRIILIIADLILVPIQPNAMDMAASQKTIKVITSARSFRGGKPRAIAFLNRVETNTRLATEAKKALDTVTETLQYGGEIPNRQAIARAMGEGNTVFDAKSKGARDAAERYQQLFQGFHL